MILAIGLLYLSQGRPGDWVVALVCIGLGNGLLILGLRNIFHRRPILMFDSQGFSYFRLTKADTAWELIAQATIIGEGEGKKLVFVFHQSLPDPVKAGAIDNLLRDLHPFGNRKILAVPLVELRTDLDQLLDLANSLIEADLPARPAILQAYLRMDWG